MNARVAPLGAQDMKSRVVEFARAASTEISTMDEATIGDLVGVLPKGITIYVAHTPKASLDDVVRVAAKVQQLGFRASPHIVARRLESEQALRTALGQLTQAGVEQVLLVGRSAEPACLQEHARSHRDGRDRAGRHQVGVGRRTSGRPQARG